MTMKVSSRLKKSVSREILHIRRAKRMKLTDISSITKLQLKSLRKLKRKSKRRKQPLQKNFKKPLKNKRRSTLLKLQKPARMVQRIITSTRTVPARLSRKFSTLHLKWKLKNNMTALTQRNATKLSENLDNLLKLSQETKQQPSMKKRKPKQLQLPRLFHPLVKALMLNLVNSLDLRVKRVKL